VSQTIYQMMIEQMMIEILHNGPVSAKDIVTVDRQAGKRSISCAF
jgi:hypothetical protein